MHVRSFPPFSSNRDLLLEVGLIQHENISMDEYKSVVNNLNDTAYNITIETCSLSKELDNVSTRRRFIPFSTVGLCSVSD